MGEDYELRGPEAVKVLRLLPKEPKADDKKEKKGKRKLGSTTLWGGRYDYEMETGEAEVLMHRDDDEEDIDPEFGRAREEEQGPATPPVAIEEEAAELDEKGKEVKRLLDPAAEDEDEDPYLAAALEGVDEKREEPPDDDSRLKRPAPGPDEAAKRQKTEAPSLNEQLLKEVLRRNNGKISVRALLVELKEHLKTDENKALLKVLVKRVYELYNELGRPYYRLKA